jgi:hypothetical protein
MQESCRRSGISTKFCRLTLDNNRHSRWHMKMHLNNILNQFELMTKNIAANKHFKSIGQFPSAVVELINTGLLLLFRHLYQGSNTRQLKQHNEKHSTATENF